MESAHYLAEYLHDVDSLHPDIQDRLENLLKEWRGVFLKEPKLPDKKPNSSPRSAENSPRGLTLSVYYEKVANRMQKTLRRKNRTFKSFSQYVWLEPKDSEEAEQTEEKKITSEELNIGSRPMESTETYLKFLDIFFAVCFSKLVDEEKESGVDPLKPLLQDFGAEIVDKELRSLVHQSITSFQKTDGTNKLNFNHSPSFPPSPRSPSPGRKFAQLRPYSDRIRSTPPMSPQSRVGLFRSRSLSELRDRPKSQGSPTRPRKLDLSLVNEADDDDADSKPPSPRRSRDKKRSADKSRSRSGDRPMKLDDLRISSSPRKVERSSSQPDVGRPLRRAMSEDLGGPDPLDVPILQSWILERMNFGKPYENLETLLEWLARWAGRNHTLGTLSNDVPNKASMRIRVPPRVIIYSLWQREQNYENTVPPADVATTHVDLDEEVMDRDTQTDVTITGIDDEYDIISVTGLPDDFQEKPKPKKKSKKKKDKKEKKKSRSPRLQNGPVFPQLQNAMEQLTETVKVEQTEEVEAQAVWKTEEEPVMNGDIVVNG